MEHEHHHPHQHEHQHVSANPANPSGPIGNEGLFLSYNYLGSYLLCLALWWWIQALKQCYSKLAKNPINEKYTASISYGLCHYKRIHIHEGFVKLICCIIGLIVEWFTLKYGRHHEYAQFPFYTAFLTAALLDLCIGTIIIAPPKGFDYIMHALPFFIHGYCLRAQSYDQPPLTETCRLLISYWAVITGLSILCEMLFNQSLIWTCIKCFSVQLHATWICQVGYLLNSPFTPVEKLWKEDDHAAVMYTVIIFVWHMFFNMIVLFGLLILVAKYYGVSPDWMNSAMDSSTIRRTTVASHKYDRPVLNKSNIGHSSFDNIEYTQLLNNTDYVE
ncbi:unnamed protein product [Schistosoma turkestanicum]|nr:unnamed protein product [Schistosoma turkestanicum]